MNDIGLTHIALQVANIERSVAFYAKYAGMQVVHERSDATTGHRVAWLSDRTRPFVVVLIESGAVGTVLAPIAHLGVGCASRADIDRLAALARAEGALHSGPEDWGYPVGYWVFLRDPDGHTLELSFGQEVGLAVTSSAPPAASAPPAPPSAPRSGNPAA